MSAKANVVIGEAPESDSEDELNVSDGVAVSAYPTATGNKVPGEAPESGDESVAKSTSLDSISSAQSASALLTSKSKQKSQYKDISLLGKKLCERNMSLAKNISDFASNAISSANAELNTVDQHLLKCQVQVQEAADLLKTLNSNIVGLEEKLRILITSDFIPEITVPESA